MQKKLCPCPTKSDPGHEMLKIVLDKNDDEKKNEKKKNAQFYKKKHFFGLARSDHSFVFVCGQIYKYFALLSYIFGQSPL